MFKLKARIWIIAAGIWIGLMTAAATGALGAELAADTLEVRLKVADVSWRSQMQIQGIAIIDSQVVRLELFPVKQPPRPKGPWKPLVGMMIFAGTIVGWAYVAAYSADH